MKKITLLFSLLTIIFNLQAQSTATYDIVFTSTWNATEHTSIPSNAHWSRLVGANHNSNVSFINTNSMVSDGIELIAETGVNDTFKNTDVQNAINAENAEQYILGPTLETATGTISITGLTVSDQFPLLSLFTMVAPSPDWMVVIDDIELKDSSGNWKTLITIPALYVYDAGTDGGSNYTSNNANTNAFVSVFDASNPIAPFNGNPIGYMTITLTNVLSIATAESQPKVTLFPNPSKGEITISNTSALKTIEIYDVLGQLVQQQSIANTNTLSLNLNALNKGMYLVKLNNINGHTQTQKLILQ